MKLESEVIADPKGTAVNQPLVRSSLDSVTVRLLCNQFKLQEE